MTRFSDWSKSARLNRRRFLETTAIAAAATALGGLAGTSRAKAAMVHKIRLDVNEVKGKPAYNSKVPGPTLTAKAGDWIDVHLVNNLPALHDDCPPDGNHNQLHGANTTNLHTHGLHVRPDRDSSKKFEADNIFLKITPKGQIVTCGDADFRDTEAEYRFELPDDHPSGTFWYHAHKHGSTRKQVVDGLAGPLIIQDPPRHMPPYIEKAPQKTFMLTPDGTVLAYPDGGGEWSPTVKMAPGAVERWRIINANPGRTAFVRLAVESDKVQLWQMAFDGLTLPERIEVKPKGDFEPWLNAAGLAPGNRTDLLVYVPEDAAAGPARLLATQASMEFLHAEPGARAITADPFEIKIEIAGEAVTGNWSDDPRLPGPGVQPIDKVPSKKREVIFAKGGGINIDGEKYDGKVKQVMKLGTTEEWTVFNESGFTHPFHIHVNPFLVTHIKDEKPLDEGNPLRRWQDTVALPPKGFVKFRTRFARFTGAFVIHCHILGHEDGGMMQKVEVVS